MPDSQALRLRSGSGWNPVIERSRNARDMRRNIQDFED